MAGWNRAKAMLFTVVLAAASAGWAEPEVTEEQLEYSKKMFGEGEAAMTDGDYATALAKFQDGYRYAPHLHLFNFNIASAADALGDCNTAMQHFQMFVDLVDKHPQRKAAKARLGELRATCEPVDPGPSPTEETEKAGGSTQGQLSREERAAVRAMNQAYLQLRSAQQLYEAAKTRHPDAPFGGPARRKRRHAKKVLKLAQQLGVEIERNAFETLDVPETSEDACREAERRENAIRDAIDDALEHYDDDKSYKTFSRVQRASERDRVAFDACT